MHRIQQLPLLEYLIQDALGKEKFEALSNNQGLLIRTGYQIAAERNIRALDAIQALQVILGIWPKDQEVENDKELPQTMTEILKHSLMPGSWRRKWSTLAHHNAKRSSLSYDEIMAEYERIGIEVIKEVCAPKKEKVEAKAS